MTETPLSELQHKANMAREQARALLAESRRLQSEGMAKHSEANRYEREIELVLKHLKENQR